MVFVKISCPARFDTDNSLTFSPELEVAEGADSSPEARNLGSLSCCKRTRLPVRAAPVVDAGVVVDLNARNAASSVWMTITSGVSSFEAPARRIDLPVKITTSVVY